VKFTSMSVQAKVIFRHDIAGLRAWAVLAVALFHFGVPGFGGGFIGVDIFFVISGFLMARIIIQGLEGVRGESFSVWQFYLSRARRIVPALLVLCLAMLILGYLILPATDYKPLGMHVLASILFISNIQYWREAGYFDIASHDKWLLHTWSLSLEWQFYLLLPLILCGLWKLWPDRKKIAWILFIALVISFALSIGLTNYNPEAAFFLLPTRAWEMLAGTLVALCMGTLRAAAYSHSKKLEALGVLLIGISLFTANPTYWPGSAALLPVIGTILVLIAQRQASAITSLAVLQHLGKWSYSIYLWHWPICVALIYLGYQGQLLPIVLGLMISLLFGWISYRWIEPLGQLGLGWSVGNALRVFFLAILAIATTGMLVRILNGVPGRLSPKVEVLAAASNDSNPFREKSHTKGGVEFKSYVYGGPNVKVIVWGDSHASAIVTAVQASLSNPEDGVLGMSYTSCPTLFDVRQERKDLHCAQFNEWAMSKIGKLPSTVPVIIVNRASAYLYGNTYGANTIKPSIYFGNTLDKIDKSHLPFLQEYEDHLVSSMCRISKTHPVYLMRPLPEMPVSVPKAMARAAQLNKSLEVNMPITIYQNRNAAVWAAQDRAAKECGITLLDPLRILCEEGSCKGAVRGIPRYYDDNHLSFKGAETLASVFKDILYK
jgi:peptidoglycan/LPS O-acetylase OafA/YrhL